MAFDPKAASSANSLSRRSRVAAMCTDRAVATFHAHTLTAKVSVNVDGQKLRANFDNDRMLSSFEHELERASGDPVLAEANYVKAQAAYLARRRTFEKAFGQTDAMLYGVANTGNTGTLGKYGQFCAVLEVCATNADDTYVIPCNSLGDANRPDGYVDSANTLKQTELSNDIAGVDDLAYVVTEERAHTLGLVSEAKWADVVCGGDHSLVEVLMRSEPVTSITEVRMRQRYADVLNRVDRAARNASRSGSALKTQKRTKSELQGFRALVRSRKKLVTVQ
jgi:hypothetical protein